jgi:hypothetical protein
VTSSETPVGHVFISYAHEDSNYVDRLQRSLEEAKLSVWRDKSSVWPGENWRIKVRSAITDNTLVFIACFSSASVARKVSYQNEEIILAIEQLRQRPQDEPWLIPIRFDECTVPDIDLGAGRTLTDIQSANLYGSNYDAECRRLVTTIFRLLGASGSRDDIPLFRTTGQQESKPRRTAPKVRGNRALIAAAVIGVSGLSTAAVAAASALIDRPQSAGSHRAGALHPIVSPSPAATSRHRTDRKRKDHSQGPSGPTGLFSPAPEASGPVTAPTNPSHPRRRHTPRPSNPPPSTYAETVGGTTHTWSDYADAGGSQGKTIASYKTVQITCRVHGFAVQDGNTWWYQIASSPWNSGYYASADAFYNDGSTSGSLIGTPYYDPSVPEC